jgi:hypothetical protein
MKKNKAVIVAPPAPPSKRGRVRAFLADLKTIALRFLCAFTQHGGRVRVIGELTKLGFRPVPLKQCSRCGTIGIGDADAKRLGGRPL